jgi:hypothetical protein
VHDNGTFTPASAVSAPPAVSTDPLDLTRPPFGTVRRGYDPSAVDAHIARLEEALATLRTALDDSERRRAMAEQHALAVEEEIRVVRSGLVPNSDTGFGARAERMLRLAESEAEQIRAAANRAAAEVTERALTEAERHRHDVRQRLIAESARAAEQAARRGSELQEREDALNQRLAGAHAAAESIRSAAERAAEAHRAAAQADVDELRDRAARDLARARELAERDLARLRDLQGAARLEVARLAAVIRAELAGPAARPSPGPNRRAAHAAGGTPPAGPPRPHAEVAVATA